MVLEPIFSTPLETDAYKLSMMNIAFKRFNHLTCKWAFKNRNPEIKFSPEMITEIREQIDHYCSLRFSADEIAYLRKTMPWLSDGFLNFLKYWQMDRKEILINELGIQSYDDCGLAIEVHGTWLSTSFAEIAILAIVNEVYFSFTYGVGAKDIEFQKRTIEKFSKLREPSPEGCEYSADYKNSHPYEIGTFSEFGLRRRLSSKMQDWLIKFIVESKVPGFVGTSNVYLARKYGVKPVGTQAHEYIMSFQGDMSINPAYSNMFAMDAWTEEYGTKNGIVLSDTITTDCFLRDFNDKYANLFRGVRHDSGDPITWGEKIIEHYTNLGIDPKTKTLLFSDSLNFEKATKIREHFKYRAQVAFGIGTWLSNDTDVSPLNIVCKLIEVNGHPVAKISDEPSKGMCRDALYVNYLQRCIDWRMTHEK